MCSLCNSVIDGMVAAAQEFRLQALLYICAILLVYLHFVLVVKLSSSLHISLTSVCPAKLAFELCNLLGLRLRGWYY